MGVYLGQIAAVLLATLSTILGVLAGYAAAALLLGAVLFELRDA